MKYSFVRGRIASISILATLLPLGSRADIIAPVNVWASSYFTAPQQAAYLINGGGLNTSSGNILTYTHAMDASAGNMWAAGSGQGVGGIAVVANQYLVFDLGMNYDLTNAYFWQMVQTNLMGRGIKDFALYGSSTAPSFIGTPPASYDITGFSNILSTTTLAQGTNTPATTQVFALSGATNVRQVYVDIISAWSGAASEVVGLSEVRFAGTAVNPVDGTNWINAAGGTWQTGGNWSIGAMPDPATGKANFSLNNTYSVSLGVAATGVNKVDVSAGNVTITNPNNVGVEFTNILVRDGATLNATGFRGGSLSGPVVTFYDMTISSGGKVNSTPNANSIGVGISGNATAKIEGAGSQLNSNGGIYVGGDSGTGVLDILDGGQVTANAGGNEALPGNIAVIGSFNAIGTVNVDGVNSKFAVNAGNLDVGFGDGTGSGTLTVKNGGQVVVGGHIDVGAYGGAGSVTVGKSDGTDPGSKIIANSMTISNGYSRGAILNLYQGGNIEVSGAFRADSLNFEGELKLNIAGGQIKANYVSIVHNGFLNWTSGTIWLTGDSTTNNWFGIDDTAPLNVPLQGRLQGSGYLLVVATVTGELAPGNVDAAGKFRFDHGLTLSSTSTVEMDLFSTSSFDTIDVDNQLTYAGGLVIDLGDGYTPLSGATFDLFNFGSRTGTFSSITLMDDRYTASLAYATGILTLNAVPEPGTVALLGLAGVFLIYRRRRTV